ncbi:MULTISPECIES: cytochrome c biogenesis protein CcsA [unclassified Spirosoma]|uniref:cytochrome c biogenesis protein CcsA n=1 Tax=unclassified Spirosoma TaxID=2621999 RepID=UPI000969C5D3|nr:MULTISPECIES: cytochrome c biogenesis protein CcsA [unclassified Spirosoma]MBN8825232.1 cytochrome c biogenesis protein CcsA [Spirosoma sp.]OJW75280.1 MAG: cytochrome C biogenesis protein [Spirosoma sp. 48-14]
MIHTTVGNLGHFFVILSFVTALVATVGYFLSALGRPAKIETQAVEEPQLAYAGESANEASFGGKTAKRKAKPTVQITEPPARDDWRKLARWAFYLHGTAVVGVAVCLFYIIFNHYFEYHYAWSHSSRALPIKYMIACFWESQEGSFLLWLFWNAVLGAVLIRTAGSKWEAPMMTIFALVQAFLASMILGVVFGDSFKIGSSPFLLLRDAMPDAPIFATDPNFIPKDGNGLNPLLQNYWMVIHPPTLFLGFALTLVPFAFCVAGLWRNQPSEWIRPALPWALFGAMILGVGIMMGGYWAYETLNFGGYWNWDPVENAVYVPWLVMVASIHGMLIAKRSSTGLKTAIILAISTFLLVLYATFLTRSGILGNASVHSFTDLGLSGQLLIYLLVFVAVSIVLAASKWKFIPSDEKEASVYTKEFWLFMGATVLCLAAFQVIATTSIPVYTKILESFGKITNLALPADQIAHYNKFQIWFFVAICLLTGVGQYMWWRKIEAKKWDALITPGIITLLISAGLIAFGSMKNPVYMALLVASVFALVTNGSILIGVIRGNYRFSGGAIAHIGMALMLLGILYSAGFSKVISLNTTGLLISKQDEFTKNDNKENKENTLLWLNQPERMGPYQLTYRGQRIEARDVPGYLSRKDVMVIEGDFHGIAQRDIEQNGKVYYKKGDTLALYPENTYYEVEYREPGGKVFSLYPRAQVNERMGLLASPDIRHKVDRDMYTYVSSVPDPNAENKWEKTETYSVAIKDTFFLNDYVAILDDVVRTNEVDGIEVGPEDAAVRAHVRVLDKNGEHMLTPAFVIKNRMVAHPAEISDELGVRIQLNEIDPRTGKFSFAVNRTQRDYIVMKAVEKPLINILWIGTLVVVLGLSISTVRRYREFQKSR